MTASFSLEFTPATIGLVGVYLLFLGAITTVVGALTWPTLAALPLQARSLSFPRASGEVVASRVDEIRGDESTRNVASIRVQYVVSGRRYETSRVDFSPLGTYGVFNTSAARLVERYPVGARVVVAYDPEAPRRAALEPGFVGAHLGGLALFVPVYLTFVGFLVFPVAAWRMRSDPIVRVSRVGTQTRLHLTGHWIGMAFAATLLATACSCCCGSLVPRDRAGLGFASFVWFVELSMVVLGTIMAIRDERSGRWDVILNGTTQELSIPPETWRGPVRVIDARDVRTFSLQVEGPEDERRVHVIAHLRAGKRLVVSRDNSLVVAEAAEAALREAFRRSEIDLDET